MSNTKGILEFNLDDQDSLEKFQRAVQADEMSLVLFDFDQYLRSSLKYEKLSKKEYRMLENIREELWNTCRNYNITLDGIIR